LEPLARTEAHHFVFRTLGQQIIGNLIISTQVAPFSVPEIGQETQKVANLPAGAVKGTSAAPVRGSEYDLVAHLVRDEGVAGSNPATPTRAYRKLNG
jgi:hypothetical protein